jgi:hypothetical protein
MRQKGEFITIVGCRAAIGNEVPPEATALLAVATSGAQPLMRSDVTYAHAGLTRPQKDLGSCPVCGRECEIRTTGGISMHRSDPVECPGVAGVGKVRCVCGKEVKCTRAGRTGRHRILGDVCPGSDSFPAGVVEVSDLPPVESAVLRLVWGRHRYAFGVWLDGAFSHGLVPVTTENDGSRVTCATRVGLAALRRAIRG